MQILFTLLLCVIANILRGSIGTLYIVPSSNNPGEEIGKTLEMVLEIKYPNYDSAFKLYTWYNTIYPIK